jgi:hypothetical protein
MSNCEKCEGMGRVTVTKKSLAGEFLSTDTCPDCYGFGHKRNQIQHQCLLIIQVAAEEFYVPSMGATFMSEKIARRCIDEAYEEMKENNKELSAEEKYHDLHEYCVEYLRELG